MPLAYIALVCWTIALTVGIYNRAILSSDANIGILVNSDDLLPAQMAWDLHHNWHAWTNFQWPRVPSLVPDMVWFWSAQGAGMSWRQAYLGYTWVIVATFSGAIGIAAHSLQAKSRRSLAASLFLASLVPFAIVTATYFGQAAFGILRWKDLLSVLIPATHGDGMVFALLATATAARAVNGGRIARRLALASCAIGMVCDALFLFEFLIPFILVERWAHVKQAATAISLPEPEPGASSPWSQRGRQVLHVVLQRSTLIRELVLASAGGWLLTDLLYRQPVAIVDSRNPFTTLPLIAPDFIHSPWTTATVIATAVLLAYVWLTFGHDRPGIVAPALVPWPPTSRRLILGTAAGAALISLMLMIPLYVETYNWRYAMAAQIWPATVLVAVAATNTRHGLRVALGCLMLISAQSAFSGPLQRAPALLQWHSNVEMCLIAAGKQHHLGAGMATYWNARQTEASSDWHQQSVLIDDLGRRRMWGNDMWYFDHDMTRIDAPTRFNFIVVDKAVRVPEIVKRYGSPVWIFECHDKAVPDRMLWIYDHNLILANTP
ncbi:hypothetical protein [Novosphingobium sp.]|uniref:hypothetical protein n=1 Tax=Novosphingobium sp. TaxID=1874826 RepID=UPI003D13F736